MTWILFFLVSFASLAGIIVTPALPHLVQDFGLHPSAAQYVLSGYLLGYAAGIPIYGPLANHLGRKKTVFISLVLCFLGTILCLIPDFSVFIIGRVVQALGGAGLYKIVFTMISDRYEEKQAYSVLAKVMLAFGIMPGIANLIGGILTHYFLWQSCFIFLLIYLVFLTILAIFLTETAHKLSRDALKWSKIISSFSHQFTHRKLVLNAILTGFGTSFTYVFAAQAPLITATNFNMQSDRYGWFSLIPSIGLSIGLLMAKKMVHTFSLRPLVGSAIMLFGTGSIAFSVISGNNFLTQCLFFLLFAYIQCGNGFLATINPVQAMARAKDKSYAAAVFQFINIFVSMISTWASGILFPKSNIGLSLSFCIFSCGMVAMWCYLYNKKKGHI